MYYSRLAMCARNLSFCSIPFDAISAFIGQFMRTKHRTQSNSIQFNWTHFAVLFVVYNEKKNSSLCCVIWTSNNHHIKYQVWTDVEGTCCGNVQLTHHFTVWMATAAAAAADSGAVVPLVLLLLLLFCFVHFNSFSSTTTYYIILLLLLLPLLLYQIEILSSWFFYPASIWFFLSLYFDDFVCVSKRANGFHWLGGKKRIGEKIVQTE